MSAIYNSELQENAKIRTRPFVASMIMIGGLISLVIGMAISISFGAANIDIYTVWEAVFSFDSSLTTHQIIQEIRIPRVIGGAIVGACFAVSGSIMQGMTRNPLADSGLLGINAGAGFMLAICFALFPGMSYINIVMFAMLGAGIGMLLVFGIGSMARGGLTPVRLVLAGAAVSALLVALSEGIALHYRVGQDIAFWFAGGVAGTRWSHLAMIAPWIAIALIAAIVISRSITVLSLGAEIAVGLGQRTKLIKTIGMIIVLILAGVAVSVVGAVSFIGLIIPHLTRYLVGVDYRLIIPCSAILGSLLVVLADLGARMINPPHETPLGAIIALIGVPFFLYLARKERRSL